MSSGMTEADAIRILVATDNHVGYNERDAVRGDDSWKSFDEVLRLARKHDVDMVLLAGDLFHENKPSRKAMYQVMRSLRENCFGEKPCELEMLSDSTEHFAGAFNHVNYEDTNINVSIPVFSIHGNHDDPSGEGNFAALDILQASGLINYYGRVPEADRIDIKPLCLQKGMTKLALYGLSNVRDERLFRTFRDDHVEWWASGTQKEDFFNLLSVHQNHHAYTETGYFPESYIPDYMDLVVWGHEHECKIDPRTNADKGFKVMQPGSSVATSLDKTEAVPKHVAIVTVTGKDFNCKTIRLRTVRPFVFDEVVLRDHKEMCAIATKSDNRTKITQFLMARVEKLIKKAQQEWLESREDAGDASDDEESPPLPMIRLRVDHTPPTDGGEFNVENSQRFSARFKDQVANALDVVQYHRKRNTARSSRNQPDMPDERVLAEITLDSVKVEKLVQEFLTAQALSILPQNSFSNAVSQFVDKDDRHAMEDFVKDSLESQVDNLMVGDDDDDVNDQKIYEIIEARKLIMEEAHAKGELKRNKRKTNRKPRPAGWDSDENGPWEESILSIIHEDEVEAAVGDGGDDADVVSITSGTRTTSTRGRGGRGSRVTKAPAPSTRKAATKSTASATKASATTKGRKRQVFEEEDDDDDNDQDIIMLDDDDDNDDDAESALFVSQASSHPAVSTSTRAATQRSTTSTTSRGRGNRGRGASTAAAPVSSGRQSTLNFGTQGTNGTGIGSGSTRTAGRSAATRRVVAPSDDDISDDDDDDAFEPVPTAQRTTRRR